MKKIFLLIVLAFSLSINAQEKNNLSKTDEVLSKAVEKWIQLAEKTGNFVIEQAPDLLKEFYKWHICSNIFGIVLGLLLCFLGYKIPFLWITKKEKDYCDDKYFNRYSKEAFVGWIVFAIFNIIGIIFLFSSIYELTFILVAPKLYLIEYFIK